MCIIHIYIRLYELYCIFKLRVYIVNALITVSHRTTATTKGNNLLLYNSYTNIGLYVLWSFRVFAFVRVYMIMCV